jgi:protein-disulfide isomerase
MLPIAFVTGLAVGFLAWGRPGATPTPARESLAGLPTTPTDGPRMNVSVDDDPAIGPVDAPITIVEFSDFNCPYCQRFQQQTFQPLLDAFPDQIRFVYRDFPITSQDSFYAAQAAECAGDQDAYWEYHDALFSGVHGLGNSAYRQYAEELGLDADALMACVDEGRYAEEVQADAQDASSLGVSGTPTFFINGIPMVGAQPLSRFTQVIDAELN